jgi:hypothetical protein
MSTTIASSWLTCIGFTSADKHYIWASLLFRCQLLYRVTDSGRLNNLYSNHISSVMVSVLTSSAINHGFKPRFGQTKIYRIGTCICCFSAKHTALRSKSKNWLPRNQNNVSEWSHISTCRLLFQYASTIKIQSSTKWTSSSHRM